MMVAYFYFYAPANCYYPITVIELFPPVVVPVTPVVIVPRQRWPSLPLSPRSAPCRAAERKGDQR